MTRAKKSVSQRSRQEPEVNITVTVPPPSSSNDNPPALIIERGLITKAVVDDKGQENVPGPYSARRRNTETEDTLGEMFYVEAILGMKVENKQRSFLVKWSEYSAEHNTWEPEINLDGCKDLVDKYVNEHNADLQRKRTLTRQATKLPKIPEKKAKVETTSQQTGTVPASTKEILKNDSNVENKAMPMKMTNARVVQVRQSKKSLACSQQAQGQQQEQERMMDLDPTTGYLLSSQQLNLLNIKDYQRRGKSSNLAKSFKFKAYINGAVTDLTFEMNMNDDKLYNLTITEDIELLHPKHFYSIIESQDGRFFCLVQFEENFPYVDLVPAQKIFDRYPLIVKQIKQLTARSQPESSILT